MKQCKTCGRENEATNNFCVACGKSLNLINPNKKQEIIVYVVNFILLILVYKLLFAFALVVALKLFLSLGLYQSSTYSSFWQYFFDGLGPVFLIYGILMLVFITFNIIMGKKMYKRNKEKRYAGKYKKIRKITYAFLTFFLGQYGVHRFVIGDIKGGIIRLIIALTEFCMYFNSLSYILSHTTNTYSIIAYICYIISHSWAISDFVIGLSKVSNENELISI